MFISPQTAIENNWIVLPSGEPIAAKYIQPNAIDFTLDVLSALSTDVPFELSESHKVMRPCQQIQPITDVNGNPYWNLNYKTTYDGMSNMYVDLPEGVAALLIVRSTLNRNAVTLTSGLFDSGFKGNIGFAVHNNAPTSAMIWQGTRVGQIIFVKSEEAGLYAGGYNTNIGQHWADTNRAN